MTVLEIRGPRDVRYQVDLDALPHLRTYGDVKRHLRDQGIDAVGHLLNGDRKFLSSDLIDPSVTWFELQPYQVHVTVLHAGHTWNDNVDARSTPADIKIAFSSALGEIDCPLTFQGRVLSDDVTLDDLGLDVDRIELHGQLVITIVDDGEHYEVHAQSDWTLEQLSARFFEQYSMIHRDGTYFTAAPSDPEDARIRTDDSVLDIVNAVEAATIYMHTPSFFVYMRDITHRPAGSSGAGNNRPMTDPNNPNRDVRIEVRHTSTGVDLIAKYNEQNTDNPLTNADALLWRDKEITAELPLRKCSVPNDAVIEVRRDLVNVYRGEYTCGRCGVDVHLSKSEPVRCRECGYRIVYKKRTNVACQYVCR